MDMAIVAPESVSIQKLVMDGRLSREATRVYANASNSPARGRGYQGAQSGGGDFVDVTGLDAVGDAIRQYRGQEALPIPDAVGKAIRSLVREVLDGLPHGGFFAT
ncbi:MAG: hypothetical protein HQM03_17830 [Magnetococcales bacterium]|nr:hypothetical protein [Magnetococcales bacterium]